MSSSKFGKCIFVGALVGAVVSMFDKTTRKQVTEKSKELVLGINFYTQNPDVLKSKVMEKKEKFQTLYEQLAGDATYIKAQVEELKILTPQVKDIVMDTKDTFVESKDEYKSIVNDSLG
ncbi:YtxH domain-containing protein [Sporosarcina sp. NPDC096371]|uniref:YtxH domain-containing protein n=1 Tax=Sporosarcina sp. NPDC096371 TaxID=3364530 RepID=UPI0038114F93